MKGPPPLPKARARSDRALPPPAARLGSLAPLRSTYVHAAALDQRPLLGDQALDARARAQSGVVRRAVERRVARTVRMHAAPTPRKSGLLLLATFAAVLLATYALVLWLRPPLSPARAAVHIAPGTAELLPIAPREVPQPPAAAIASNTAEAHSTTPAVSQTAPAPRAKASIERRAHGRHGHKRSRAHRR